MKFTFSNIGEKIGIGATTLLIFVFCFACQNAQTKSLQPPAAVPTVKPDDVQKWIPGSYSGIEIGVSTRADLIKNFGKPLWEGDETLEGEDEDVQQSLVRHSGKRLLLEYTNIGGVAGKTSILIGEKDKIVQAIDVYPTAPFTKAEIISKYGADFVEKYSSESICAAIEKPRPQSSPKAGNEPQVSAQNNLNSPEMLVFPHIGMYASLEKNERIDQLGFTLKCGD